MDVGGLSGIFFFLIYILSMFWIKSIHYNFIFTYRFRNHCFQILMWRLLSCRMENDWRKRRRASKNALLIHITTSLSLLKCRLNKYRYEMRNIGAEPLGRVPFKINCIRLLCCFWIPLHILPIFILYIKIFKICRTKNRYSMRIIFFYKFKELFFSVHV